MKVTILIISTISLLSAQDVVSQKLYKSNHQMLLNDQFSKYEVVDENPIYSNGQDSLDAYLNSASYSKDINNYFGFSFVLIIVDQNGFVQQAQLLRSLIPHQILQPLIDKLNVMNKWTPALKNGENVNSIHVLKILVRGGKLKVSK